MVSFPYWDAAAEVTSLLLSIAALRLRYLILVLVPSSEKINLIFSKVLWVFQFALTLLYLYVYLEFDVLIWPFVSVGLVDLENRVTVPDVKLQRTQILQPKPFAGRGCGGG